MREWKACDDIEKRIREMPAGTRALIRDYRGKAVRRRPRDKGEQDVLDLLCKKKRSRG